MVGSLLVLLAGIQLFVLTERTDHWFAWTIAIPLTAAFLGAFYLTAIPLAALSGARRAWADARVGIAGVFIFLALTLVTTLLHLNKFHLHDTDHLARGAAWLWLVIYAGDPLLVLAAWVRQSRAAGADPPRMMPVPTWYMVGLGVQAVIVLAVGASLFARPGTAAHLWPWRLTPNPGISSPRSRICSGTKAQNSWNLSGRPPPVRMPGKRPNPSRPNWAWARESVAIPITPFP